MLPTSTVWLLGGYTGQEEQRSHTVWSLLQEFLLGWVSFSIISTARTSGVLVRIVGVFAQWITASAKRPGLWPQPVVLLTDLLVLGTKALDVSKDTLPWPCQQTSSYHRLPGLQARLSLMDYVCAHEILGPEGDANQF